MKVKKNLSEELVINDDISLGKDEEEIAKENEKAAEDNEKEVNKELADRVDKVEEINEFEADPIEIKDGEEKKVKIKGLTEKLILDEDDDSHTLNEDTITEEEVLDEKIPRDLAKAYKKGGYHGRGRDTDLQNSEYTEVSPEEGYKLYKQDPRQIRLVINDRFVDFRDDGRQSDVHRIEWLPNDLVFVNRNGKRVKDTMYIPPKQLFNIASKIYVTNEHTPEGQKDQELLNKRAANPDSPHWAGSGHLRNYGFGRNRWNDNNTRRGEPGVSAARNRRSVDSAKSAVNYYKDKLASADASGNYSWRTRDDYVRDVRDAEKRLAKTVGKAKDDAARRRYADSEVALQRPMERYKEIKSNLDNLQSNVESTAAALDKVRNEGSPVSKKNRDKLRELNAEIAALRRKVALVELDLEETDEEDAKAIASAEARFDSANAEFVNARRELDRLLRKQQ